VVVAQQQKFLFLQRKRFPVNFRNFINFFIDPAINIEETADESPPDEHDEKLIPPSFTKHIGSDFYNHEENKDFPNSVSKVRESFVKSAAGVNFKRSTNPKQEFNHPKICKSSTCQIIDEYDEINKPNVNMKKQKATIKDSKSPDPFEQTHSTTENRIMELMNSTKGILSPLQELRKSGNKSPAALKAYKRFIISLFESASFIRKMTPIDEHEVILKKLYLPKPSGLTCKLLL